jgi:hypothetical protein
MTKVTKSKIGFSSRYYEPLRILKSKVASHNVFKLVYNEDKDTYSLPYLYGNYKHELEPISLSANIVNSVKQYLEYNLFSLEEKKLLLSELMPHVKSFGHDTINSLTNRINLSSDKSRLSNADHIAELEKTIKSLNQINVIINNEFIAFFTDLTSNTDLVTHNILTETKMKTKEQIAEIILDQFRKTNCKTNHIVMMNVFRHSVIPKLNPKEKELFADAANFLIDNGYITYEDASSGLECFRLTEKGYDSIYDDDFSLESQPIIQKKKIPTSDFPDEVYRDVLKTLSDFGKDLEKKPKVYSRQDEEGLRDHFLTNLTGRYEKTTATGESFNKEGKTDILLKDDKGNNIFIAECKWWTGAAGFHSTINQLFDNYITWRDNKVAILFFVDNKDFSNVLRQIEAEAKLHPYYLHFIDINDNSNFKFIFRQKDDANNKVQVEIMFFHFPMT